MGTTEPLRARLSPGYSGCPWMLHDDAVAWGTAEQWCLVVPSGAQVSQVLVLGGSDFGMALAGLTISQDFPDFRVR